MLNRQALKINVRIGRNAKRRGSKGICKLHIGILSVYLFSRREVKGRERALAGRCRRVMVLNNRFVTREGRCASRDD